MNGVTTVPNTRREMSLDSLDKQTAGAVTVSAVAGGVSFANAMEVMEFAKLMALADKAVPVHLRKNPGACLAVTFQAVEWRMSPFAVANKSYEVRDRIAYESQLIHAVIEARAPLQNRLECLYEGVSADRSCTVTGCFTNGDVRTYTSPKFGAITNKNSPLWTADPDQQLWYYSSRAWARKWCPDVLMGIYSREEILENSSLGREDEPFADGPGLHARLAGSERSAEGHAEGHAASELAEVAGGAKTITVVPDEKVAEPDAEKPDGKKPKGGKKTKAAAADDKAAEENKIEAALPKNPAQYAAFAVAWIKGSVDEQAMNVRWDTERGLRNDCGLTATDREPLMKQLADRRTELRAEA